MESTNTATILVVTLGESRQMFCIWRWCHLRICMPTPRWPGNYVSVSQQSTGSRIEPDTIVDSRSSTHYGNGFSSIDSCGHSVIVRREVPTLKAIADTSKS